MTEPGALLKKFQVKSGDRLWLINVPADIADMLTAGAEVEISHAGDACTGIIAFCASDKEVSALVDRIAEHLHQDVLLWFAYRKGRAEFNRDAGWDSLIRIRWRPVRQVAIDDTWSALRFRPAALVQAKPGSRFA